MLLQDTWTDKQTDIKTRWFLYTNTNFVWGGIICLQGVPLNRNPKISYFVTFPRDITPTLRSLYADFQLRMYCITTNTNFKIIPWRKKYLKENLGILHFSLFRGVYTEMTKMKYATFKLSLSLVVLNLQLSTFVFLGS